VPDTFKTPFAMFSFPDIESGLLFMPVCDVVMFKEVIYRIKKKLMTKLTQI
jgi:hypothetical protein